MYNWITLLQQKFTHYLLGTQRKAQLSERASCGGEDAAESGGWNYVIWTRWTESQPTAVPCKHQGRFSPWIVGGPGAQESPSCLLSVIKRLLTMSWLCFSEDQLTHCHNLFSNCKVRWNLAITHCQLNKILTGHLTRLQTGLCTTKECRLESLSRL